MTEQTSPLINLTVSSLADKYKVNVGKPYFPLNTLRLVYLIFMETISPSDPTIVEKRAKDILALIPLVQGLLDARSTHRAEQATFSLESEWEIVQPHIEKIYGIIDTPQVHDLFSHVFAYVFPLQDTLLLSLYNDLSNQKKFSAQDIYTIFHIRSMDSIIYSNIVGAILQRDMEASALPKDMQLSLNYKLNALYQLNDLVDAIVYAKEDMENKNFSPFELIKKASQDANEARQMIISIASAFEKRLQTFALGEQTEKLLTEFGHQLIGVIGGGQSASPSSTDTELVQDSTGVDDPDNESFADSGHSPMEEEILSHESGPVSQDKTSTPLPIFSNEAAAPTPVLSDETPAPKPIPVMPTAETPVPDLGQLPSINIPDEPATPKSAITTETPVLSGSAMQEISQAGDLPTIQPMKSTDVPSNPVMSNTQTQVFGGSTQSEEPGT